MRRATKDDISDPRVRAQVNALLDSWPNPIHIKPLADEDELYQIDRDMRDLETA